MKKKVEIKNILIFHDFFLPGIKGGGPVQSLANLIATLQDQYEFYVITSAYDLKTSIPYADVKVNEWNKKTIGNNEIAIWYANKSIDYSIYADVIKSIKADFVFFNCVYSFCFFLYPLLNKKKFFLKETKLIISPRGILHSGGLSAKPLKKFLYIFLLKHSRLLKQCIWHATAETEYDDIQKQFGNTESITIIGNIPKLPVLSLQIPNKEKSCLKLIHLSIITSVKNINTLLQSLKLCKKKIILDIFGPIKDEQYWDECKKMILELPEHIIVTHKGDLQPNQVQETIENYDSLILLSKGENFGHVLFESLSVGRPIITSYFTPWNNLQEKNAGWNVDIELPEVISLLLDNLAERDSHEWKIFAQNAYGQAINYISSQNFVESYRKLFS